MKLRALLASSLVLLAPAVFAAETKPAAPAKAAAAQRHPLRGVVTSVLADKSALMVKHEEIPGVMRAMTMMFKVDAATLKTVKQGDAITGLMSRGPDGWLLEAVKVAPAPGKK
ncbi:MAG: copper-binding protein [Verrucomicrobia bacterium]|nr:copper-binding protein [Verrucomicrobiota bacterium]